MTSNITTFISIMIFYAILSSVIGPIVFYYLGNKSLQMAGYGFIVFSIISMLLWYMYGRKMI
jgi:MFS-type transporter involved in bile tolerance (Atg22 family)